jgi:pSer/pThr/pTyr-binding forkhead associated (FHA) protein
MAMLVQFSDGVAAKKFQLKQSPLRIGRNPNSDIFIDDAVVSQAHAVIEGIASDEAPQTVEYYIQDLGSTNQTFVNNKAVERSKLQHDDVIRIGFSSFKFVDENQANPHQTAKIYKSWIPHVYYTKK